MASAEGTESIWLGGCVLIALGGCLLLCGFCRRKLPVSHMPGPQPRDSPPEQGPLYVSDPVAGSNAAANPQPPVGPCSTDNEDDDDFQYPPAPWTESQHAPVFEPLKRARESGTDVDSHGSYVNIHSEEDYVNVDSGNQGSSVEKDKEYLVVLPSEAEQTRRCRGLGYKKASLDMQKADYDYVNVP